MSGCLSRAPFWGPDLQPRHVPWLGIEPATLWFAGPHTVHWATPARAETFSKKIVFSDISINMEFLQIDISVDMMLLKSLLLVFTYKFCWLHVSQDSQNRKTNIWEGIDTFFKLTFPDFWISKLIYTFFSLITHLDILTSQGTHLPWFFSFEYFPDR